MRPSVAHCCQHQTSVLGKRGSCMAAHPPSSYSHESSAAALRRRVLRRRGAGRVSAVAEVASRPRTHLQLDVRFDEPVDKTPPTFLTTTARVVAIGDIHGDINKTMSCFELAGLATFDRETPRWTGGDTIVVQLGDILDRGDAEISTLMLIRHLDRQAREDGGAIHVLNGNHESLNVCGDFRYVTAGAFAESGMIMGLEGPDLQDIDKLVRARLALYTPGAPMAVELSKNPTALVINDTVFAHGGLLPTHVSYGLEKINAEVAAWMRADKTPDGGCAPPPYIAMGGPKAIMWNRTFGKEKWVSPVDRIHASQLLDVALSELKCKRLVVGHTPQMGGANAECDGRVWRLDVGMSRNMLDAPPCVLDLTLGADGETVATLIE